MNSPGHIFLIGFSGSGKSVTGRLLAKKLRCRFVDIDSLIEKRARKKIARIFDEDGETTFRSLEATTITELILKETRPVVAALGGGAFEDSTTRKLVKSSGTSVWLKCSQGVLYQRMKNQSIRPLLHARKPGESISASVLKTRIKTLLEKRKRDYGRADIRFSTTNKTPLQVARELNLKIRQQYATG